MDDILQWLESTALAVTIRDSLYLFPFFEAVHVIGLALVFGTIIVIDLRLLGLASSSRPFRLLARDVMKWTWFAFILTALTGASMFITNAGVYYHNTYFRVKIALLVLAGINMGIFELTTGKAAHQWEKSSVPRAGKVAAVLSLTLWVAIICMGRLIGFTTSRATVEEAAPVEFNFDDLFEQPPGDSPPAPPAGK